MKNRAYRNIIYKRVLNQNMNNFLLVVLSSWLFKSVFRLLRLGHTKKLELVIINEQECVVVPPLSGSSSIISILKNKGGKICDINIDRLDIATEKFSEITYIMRCDVDRVVSFYNKKILNADTVAKYITKASWRVFDNVFDVKSFLLALEDILIGKAVPTDKHLFLNSDIIRVLDASKLNIVDYLDFLKKNNSINTKINSSQSLIKRARWSEEELSSLNRILLKAKKNRQIDLRCMVVSSRKSGSTFLDDLLRQQKCFDMTLSIKETQFFSRNFYRGSNWYYSLFQNNGNPRIEVCPIYGNDLKALHRMRTLCPDLKVIMLCRDPLERSKSHTKHVLRNRIFIDREKLFRNFPEILEDSFYEVIYKNLITAGFKDEDIKIISSNFLFTQPNSTVSEILQFLDMDHTMSGTLKVKRLNESKKVRFKPIYVLLRNLNQFLLINGLEVPNRFRNFVIEKMTTDNSKIIEDIDFGYEIKKKFNEHRQFVLNSTKNNYH